jgi:hypothetical protein
MPSFFPGMDPFIEGADWEDLHSNIISAIQAALVPALNLQALLDGVYDRAGYNYSLDYRREIAPTLAAADAQWCAEILKQNVAG